MKGFQQYVQLLRANGGPDPHQDVGLNDWYHRIADLVRDVTLTRTAVQGLRPLFGDAFSAETAQGFSALRPHGYSGDFEIMERIYVQRISPAAHLQKWDRFFHAQPACLAVRNRKDYFKHTVAKLEELGRHV